MIVKSEDAMKILGARLGAAFRGGEVVALVGDVGAGKTTLVKGIGQGLGVDEDVQSPSFTISRVYAARDELTLAHYDFYRLNDAGIMADELAETIADPQTVTVIEWGDIVDDVLPKSHIRLAISALDETTRQLQATVPAEYSYIEEAFL